MPTLEPSVRRIEDQKAAPSTHPFETIYTESKEEIKSEETVTLWLVGFMLAIIIACGVMLWIRVNS